MGFVQKLCVQSLVSVSVLALEIPHTDSYTIVWTHENTCRVEMGSATLAVAVGKVTRISCKGLMKL